MTDVDTKLAALFATPPTPPDEAFIARVDRAVLAEEKMIAAQAAMWRRFAAELAGATAVVAAFYLLWTIAPDGMAMEAGTSGPALAAGMVILSWLGVQLKPAAAR